MCQCFARWKEINNLCFRDQTILQFGDRWDLLASFVLLNPGSAEPLVPMVKKNTELELKKLPFYVNSGDYYKFSVDPLMEDLIGLYQKRNLSGVLKLYNLFNLREPNSTKAKEKFKHWQTCPDLMFTAEEDVKFGIAPVIIACGRDLPKGSTDMLNKYIDWAKPEQLYSISKKKPALFIIEKGDGGNENGRYHPSFVFKNGSVELGETCEKKAAE